MRLLPIIVILAGCARAGYDPPDRGPHADMRPDRGADAGDATAADLTQDAAADSAADLRADSATDLALDTAPDLLPPPDLSVPKCGPEGSCDPAQTGKMCIKGKYVMPPCKDLSGIGCGDTHTSPFGYCDPRWSACAGTVGGTCAAHCASIGKTCKEMCVTSRGYGQVKGWGSEAYVSALECADPLIAGKGQDDCAKVFNAPAGRWRCCCIP